MRVSQCYWGGVVRTGLIVLVVALTGCSTPQPKNIDNACEIFEEYYDWYNAAKHVQKKYGLPIAVSMAFIHQESKFIDDNRPARERFLWIFPGSRPSSAYGYAQALDNTWREYQKSTGNWSADRDDFADSVDFIGWYNQKTIKRTGIKPHDTYRLYLAYHDGAGGYLRGTYKKKPWLMKVAKNVDSRAKRYQQQLVGCQKQLNRGWFWRTLLGQETRVPQRIHAG